MTQWLSQVLTRLPASVHAKLLVAFLVIDTDSSAPCLLDRYRCFTMSVT